MVALRAENNAGITAAAENAGISFARETGLLERTTANHKLCGDVAGTIMPTKQGSV
ncbi:MAG: hypothetical protein J0L98_07880 [Zoogloea sp.]|nr:hypothetical protein [Zoogloea sp.]